MIWVSLVRPSEELLDGLRLPSRRLRPSPKPMAVVGTPTARMSAHTIAARPEKGILFIQPATRGPHESCGRDRSLSATDQGPSALARLLGRIDRDGDVQ